MLSGNFLGMKYPKSKLLFKLVYQCAHIGLPQLEYCVFKSRHISVHVLFGC